MSKKNEKLTILQVVRNGEKPFTFESNLNEPQIMSLMGIGSYSDTHIGKTGLIEYHGKNVIAYSNIKAV